MKFRPPSKIWLIQFPLDGLILGPNTDLTMNTSSRDTQTQGEWGEHGKYLRSAHPTPAKGKELLAIFLWGRAVLA